MEETCLSARILSASSAEETLTPTTSDATETSEEVSLRRCASSDSASLTPRNTRYMRKGMRKHTIKVLKGKLSGGGGSGNRAVPGPVRTGGKPKEAAG